MLFVRADGNDQIGTGHIMRCLSIAGAVRRQGMPVTFLTADTEMHAVIKEQGFEAVCLNSTWNQLENETGELVGYLTGRQASGLLVDSYFVSTKYLAHLRRVTNLCYIDDLNAMEYPCDILVNYNCYAASLAYERRYPNTRLLLGPQFAPLRPQFQNLTAPAIKGAVASILITTGGSDPYQIAEKLLHAFLQTNLSGIYFHVVAGRYYKNLPALMALQQKHSNIFIHQDVKDMAALMRACDLAVSAGGSTLYELCSCATPTVVLTLADNQLQIAKTLSEQGVMLYAGDVRMDAHCTQSIVDAVRKLSEDDDMRRTFSRRMRALVDGNGAKRIARALLE